MRNKVIKASLLVLVGHVLYAQEPVNRIVNEGELSISSGDLVSFEGTFENTSEGDVTNEGMVIYFQDFINNGDYGLTQNKSKSTAVFLTENAGVVKQILGDGISSFYHVEFNSSVPKKAFDLKNNIEVHGTVDFQEGIVKVDSTLNPITNVSYGMLTFRQGSKASNVTDYSHVDGMIEKLGNEAFTYPIGNQEKYRYAHISAPKSSEDVFVGQYIYNDKAFFQARPNAVGVVKVLNTKEYWLIDKSDENQSDVLLTLSWDEDTTLPEVLKDPEGELHIVRWDPKAQLWVDEGGVVDMSSKEVTTIATVKGYGFFTLATVKKDWVLDGDVVIYNLVTPDGDGKNDYFIIDNIKNYPNNKVEIFNRWGARVYETQGYDPLGDGSSNVFKGYSEGKVTVDKGSKLPSGTYYYVVTYEYKDDKGSRMIKKAANLHLENN
ncbi:gliding motility-associated C-terminal domain-containing protein [Myroides odoratus]|uniref:gliding motility-associated C-terminal domain-containing protein n=1 Tax=Myroides odoratus TaxID=256 RepID=UPI0039AF67EE